MNVNTPTPSAFYVLCLCLCTPIHAAEFIFLPEPNITKTLSAETLPYTQMLHAGTENDTFYMRGRFAVDFPIVGYHLGDDWDERGEFAREKHIDFGISAAAHINMRPTSNMRFPVDNFYAVLALHLSGAVNKELSWRLYPIYHVSAHLADGYRSDILKSDVRAVSSEMVRAEGYYKPFGEWVEIGAGAGWYYHVCAQKELKYRGDVSILLTPNEFCWTWVGLAPYALLRAEDVYQGGHNLGVDVSAGMMATRDRRGIGLQLRYFNKLHSSYYFERYERGFGGEMLFVY